MIDTLLPKERYTWYSRETGIVIESVYGEIIEDFIGCEMTIFEISQERRMPYLKVAWVISLYYKKPDFSLTLMSKV